jgi:hypothetical protein
MSRRPLRNELIEHLTASLSPAGRGALEHFDGLGTVLSEAKSVKSMTLDGVFALDKALDHLQTLPAEDQGLIAKIVQLREQAAGSAPEEDVEEKRTAQLGVYACHRAHELERAAGREPDEGSMTLAQVLKILKRYGEDVPEIDTRRVVVEVPREQGRRFGEEPYPGELSDLMTDLDGRRQEVAEHLGEAHPLFRIIDGALRSGDLEELRTARAVSYGAVRTGYYPQSQSPPSTGDDLPPF